MIPAQAAKALLDHLGLPRNAISVWIHRPPEAQPGANPILMVSVNPAWEGKRAKIPGRFGDYLVQSSDWSTPLEGDTLAFAERHLIEPEK